MNEGKFDNDYFEESEYHAIQDAYEDGDWEKLAELINSSKEGSIKAAGRQLGVDLHKWFNDHTQKEDEKENLDIEPVPVSPDKPTSSIHQPAISSISKEKKHSSKWYNKKIKQAKDPIIKKAWKEAKKSGLNSKEAKELAIKMQLKDLTKQRETLKRQLRRVAKLGYKPKLKSQGKGGAPYKYSKARISGLKRETKYLKKVATLGRFSEKPTNVSGRYPKQWKYKVEVKKKQAQKVGLRTSTLSVPRKLFGEVREKVTHGLAKEFKKEKVKKKK